MSGGEAVSSAYLLADQERMSRAHNYFAWQYRLLASELGRRVVEVGCGIGNFTRLLLEREAVLAVDRDPACVARLRARFPNQANLETRVCDASRDELRALTAFRPDTVVCLNVLEHIADDRAALRNMAAIVAVGGVVALLAPACPALYGPIDARLGHFRRYRRRPLAALAEAAGLRPRRLRYVNAIGGCGWWVNARLLRRREQSAAQIAFFDRWVAPLARQWEHWVPPPFGQSLLAVFEKA